MELNKACPVVLRHRGQLEILAFEHPSAGLQLVKGGIEVGESGAMAATRELYEEAGIVGSPVQYLGAWRAPSTGQVWAFHECSVSADLPETWVHHAEDDGGHPFRFFWHPLMSEPSNAWHPIFQDALAYLRLRLEV